MDQKSPTGVDGPTPAMLAKIVIIPRFFITFAEVIANFVNAMIW
jgi:hypothetical protein